MSNLCPIQNLGDLAIAAPADTPFTAITELDGMSSVSLSFDFKYGAGGTKVQAFVQTSLDQGASWQDICCVVFTTASAKKFVNVAADATTTTPVSATDGALTDNTAQAGILGDRLRLRTISTGTYTGNTSISVRAMPRG